MIRLQRSLAAVRGWSTGPFRGGRRTKGLERARAMASEALQRARALGMEELERRAEVLLGALEPGAEPALRAAEAAGGGTATAAGTGDREGKVLPFPREAEGAGGPRGAPEKPPEVEAAFHREGEYWTVVFGGETLRLKDAKGLGYLAELLRRPGRGQYALDLVADAGGVGAERVSPAAAAQGGLGRGAGAASDAPDPEARGAYRRRIRELEAEISDAEATGECDRAASLREEQELLAGELARGLGFGTGERSVHAERARVAVTKAIRGALRKIGRESPALGSHLEQAIRTGAFCSYAPARTSGSPGASDPAGPKIGPRGGDVSPGVTLFRRISHPWTGSYGRPSGPGAMEGQGSYAPGVNQGEKERGEALCWIPPVHRAIPGAGHRGRRVPSPQGGHPLDQLRGSTY